MDGRIPLPLSAHPDCLNPSAMSHAAPLVDYLRQLEHRGESHVLLDEDARAVLRRYYRAGKAAKRPPTQAVPALKASEVAETAAPVVQKVEAVGATPEEQLASLQQQAAEWGPARALGSLRETMVFAVGNATADLMLVGEAPGYEEERRQEPFVGKAGQKLDQILKAMGISREEVYISNICKFRPALKNQTTNNRKPTREEMDACLPFVRAEISIVKPKCIVALGSTAAEGLLERQDPVGRLRGSWHEFEAIPVRVTYHPSYLLHNDSAVSEKRKVWDDMLIIMEYLGMSISQKQRGFFS